MTMLPRIIPVLLLDGGRLVKTVRFQDPVFVGDPANTLSIFNDFEVDEIALLDIGAAKTGVPINAEYLQTLASECFIPLSYGGGISSLEQARRLVAAGVEKVIVNSALVENPSGVAEMSAALGAQAVVGSVDVRRVGGQFEVFTRGGSVDSGLTLDAWTRLASEVGIGEAIVTSIDREGTRSGFDLDAVRIVVDQLDVPVVAHGGAGTRLHLREPVAVAGASAVAAGTQFVFQRSRSSVLVNYPSRAEAAAIFSDGVERTTQLPGLAEPISASGRRRPLERLGTMCHRCIVTSSVPMSKVNERGCYYCSLHDEMEAQYPTGEQGQRSLRELASKIAKDGQGKPYDCVIGVSGGCDSSYLVHKSIELGLRPLAVHFDNTWNSPTATANIYSVLNALNVDLETYVADNAEYDDIYRSFLLAGVRDVEAPTDIGFMGVLYRAAMKHGVKHILEGASFRTEGVSPLGWLYMDGGYVKSVHSRFGKLPMQTYPNMEFWQFVKWTALSGIERHRPLYHLDYIKEDAKRLLQEKYGWQWYGGHHLENRFTAFYHTYLLPVRFDIDFRQIEFSALVRSRQMERKDAIRMFSEERVPDDELLALVRKRLGFSVQELDWLITQPHHSYLEFDTYRQKFRRLRPLFWALYRSGRVPKSFYVKFCT